MTTRILIVEDSPTQAEALRSLLEGAGYRVTHAATGEDGLAQVERDRPDVVLSDIVMPGEIDGYELCRRIKAGERRDTPVVLLTSLSDPMDIIRGLECGADNFLTKPYQPALLLERLQVLLATRRARASHRVRAGVQVLFMGREFTISAEREQILDLLVTTFEEAVRQNRELRQREEELTAAQAQLARYARSLEARLESILQSVPDVLFSVAADTSEIRYVSPAVTSVFGCQPGDFTLEYWRSHIHPGDSETAGRAYELAAQRRTAQVVEYRFQRSPNDVRWIFQNLVPAANGQRRVDGIARDVTEQRKLEEQLRQAQKMEAVGRLAGGVAHDFNNLLTAILGEVDFAAEGLPEKSAALESLMEIRKASERAAGLTRQLLAFSRRQVVEPTLLSLNDLVAEAEKMLRRVIGDDVELVTRLAPDLAATKVDRGQIEQVLLNLAVNARDAMPQGGRITLETSNETLDEDYARLHQDVIPGEYTVLAMSDSGTGISPEVMAHIFEPFFTTKEPDKGTGLGLATCYGIVKQSRGHIGVYSEPGVGTTFRIYLPRVAGSARISVKRSKAEPPGGTETILLVEDSPQVRRVVVRMLGTLGYAVLEARNGEEALGILAGHPGTVHLLVTDLVMPRMGGRELAERVRALRPGIKVMFSSGYSNDVAAHQGLIERDVALLRKPYTREELGRKVRDVLDEPPRSGA